MTEIGKTIMPHMHSTWPSWIWTAAVRTLPASALLGGVLWVVGLVALAVYGNLGWAEANLLFGAAVIVPLGLALIERTDDVGPPALWRWTLRLHGLTVAAVIVAFCLPQGTVAAAWTAGYLAFTGLMAAMGVWRVLRRGIRPLDRLCRDFALISLPGAAGWLLMSRAGLTPLGFSPQIVQLTSVHLHYVGFALPLLTGLVARQTPGRLATLACLGAIVAFPAVAGGMTVTQITGARGIEIATVALVVATCWLIAWRHLHAATAAERPLALMLQSFSALSLATAMILAAIYALGQFFGTAWLDIPVMLPTHGVLNAFGFAFCGLVGQIGSQRGE